MYDKCLKDTCGHKESGQPLKKLMRLLTAIAEKAPHVILLQSKEKLLTAPQPEIKHIPQFFQQAEQLRPHVLVGSNKALLGGCTEVFSGKHLWLHSCIVSVDFHPKTNKSPSVWVKDYSFHRYCSWPDPDRSTTFLKRQGKITKLVCLNEMTGNRTRRYWIFLFSRGNLYASPFIRWAYMCNFSGSLTRYHHSSKKISILLL